MAEAFQFTAAVNGTANQLYVYLDSTSTAARVSAGLYADTGSNNPGVLLAQGTIASPAAGAWNLVEVPATTVTAGTQYWIVMLQPAGTSGTIRFRDGCCNKSQTSSQTNLSTLPTSWSSGSNYIDSPLSAYAAQSAAPSATPTLTGTSTATATGTSTSLPTNTQTVSSSGTPTATQTSTPTATPTGAATSTQTLTPAPTPIGTSVPANWFRIGNGYSDVIARQLVRTASDKVYVFCLNSATSNTILAYWTNTPGIPSGPASFTGHTQFNAGAQPISVDAVYDGGATVHVLANLTNGDLNDYPFDLTTNTYKAAKTISSGNPVRTVLPLGSAGVSGMFSQDGALNIAYWSSGDHITYASFLYDPATDTLTRRDGPTRLDSTNSGYSNHPTLAVSPVNGDITVAWLWQNTLEDSTQAFVYAITKTQSGWGNVGQVNSSLYRPWIDAHDDPAYPDTYGLNADQGPSMVITSDGVRHLSYIEAAYGNEDYGRAHYVTYTLQNGWVDTIVVDGSGNNYFTHAPSLATDGSDQIYLFGHSDWRNSAPCTASYPAVINCYMKKNPDGTWTAPQPVIDKTGNYVPPSNPQETFDDSVSIKWGVVGWYRRELVEFAFFSGQQSNYWNMSLYYGTLGGLTGGSTP